MNKNIENEIKTQKIITKIFQITFFLIVGIIILCFISTKEDSQPQTKNNIEQTQQKNSLTNEQVKEQEQAREYILQKVDEVFVKVINEDGFHYDFLIYPDVWNFVDYDKKKQIFELATSYIKIKEPRLKDTEYKVKTRIKSNSNGETLGEYSLSGLKLK